MAKPEYLQVKLRCPTKLKKQIEKFAKVNERSANREMIARLEESILENIDKDRHSQIMRRLDAIESIVKGDFYGV